MGLLQKFGFRDSRYQRPQEKWICGHMADGRPCPKGPDGRGQCRAQAACRPFLVDGRWECRRSQQDGGPCECGPGPDGACSIQQEPCRPVLSLRARRGRATRWAAALAVGLVVVILGGGTASHWLMPGPLSGPHASLTDCASCHSGIGAGPLGFLQSFAAGSDPHDNGKQCLTCHDAGKDPFTPHTYPTDDLAKLTAALETKGETQDSWVHRIAFAPPKKLASTGQPEIFCATCHTEHQGAKADLTEVSNARCQTCHVGKFGTFADSHPGFGDYPFRRRTRINFDHKSHFAKHFPDTVATALAQKAADPAGSAPQICADCHQPGPDRRYMETKAYETMCQSCHEGDVLGTNRASGPKGIDFLAVPGLDLITLEERGIDIGAWPEHSEAGITPFLKLMLKREAGGDDLTAGLEGLDLLDLRGASDEQLQAVARFAWAVKRLFARLENDRLSDTMPLSAPKDGAPMEHEDMVRLSGLIAHDVIQGANRDWFPDLTDDLGRHAKGEPTSSYSPPPAPEPEVTNEGDVSPAREPVQDDILGADTAAGLGGDDILGGDQADILGGNSGLAGDSGGEDILAAPASDDILGAPASDDILGAPASDDILAAPASDDILSAPASDDILSAPAGAGESDGIGPGDLDALAATPEESKADEETAAPPPPPFDPEIWAEFGGWYRQDATIRYRPTGHADRFIRTWLDYAGAAFGTPQEADLKPIFDELSPDDAVGRCTRCHSIDDDGGPMNMKWHGFSSKRMKGGFTTFSHAPHLSAVGDEGCATCHTLTPGGSGDFAKTYSRFDPSVFVPTFKPVEKEICATCHVRQAAGEDCTLCHAYHASEFARPMIETKIP